MVLIYAAVNNVLERIAKIEKHWILLLVKKSGMLIYVSHTVCTKLRKWALLHMCVTGIDFASFYVISIELRNGSGVVFLPFFSRLLSIMMSSNNVTCACSKQE